MLLVFAFAGAARAGAAVEFQAGELAHIVATPQTDLERRVASRLSEYLEKVLGQPTRIVAQLEDVSAGAPAILLVIDANTLPSGSLETFALETVRRGDRAIVIVHGASDRGLKRAVQRLILKSEQRAPGLVVPELRVTESPWIAQREWTLCPWAPDRVRGVFVNPNADPRTNVWLYSDQQIADYVAMFDAFGFGGAQLMECCYNYAVLGSPDAYQDRLMKFARAARRNGQDVTLWVWAAQFNGFGWNDPEVTYTPAKGRSAFEDPKVRAAFEKYYDHYARMASDVDLLIGHFYDPGSLRNRADVFSYLGLLRDKFRAKNPKIRLGVDFWASGSDGDYMEQLIGHGYGDALLLQSSLPHSYPAGKREALHETAKQHGIKMGVWGWYTTEMETDQMPTMHVNAQLLSHFYRQIRDGVHRLHPITYWSEMEAYHLNNIFTMYASAQLLWNPDRDPDEILHEIADGIWGPRNGIAIFDALKLIEDARTGPRWDTFWWTQPNYRLGTESATDDQRRANDAIATLGRMKTDATFVPKFPLPFPPETFVELMLPHLRQIKAFAEFRIEVAAIRAAAKAGAAKDELAALAQAAWKPIPDYNTWIGTWGPPETRMQEIIMSQLAAEFGLAIRPPDWLRWRDANRLLEALKRNQRATAGPWKFKLGGDGPWSEFNWSPDKVNDRLHLLLEHGGLEKTEGEFYRLANWEEFRRR